MYTVHGIQLYQQKGKGRKEPGMYESITEEQVIAYFKEQFISMWDECGYVDDDMIDRTEKIAQGHANYIIHDAMQLALREIA